MNRKFSRNSKYHTIALYSIGVIAVSTIIIRLIMHWESTAKMIGNFMSMLFPFIMGFFIAYFLNPAVKTLNHKILKPLFRGKAPGIRKALSILLSYVIIISLIVTILFYIIPQIVESLKQITTLIDSAQSGYTKLMQKLGELEKHHPELNFDTINKSLNEIPPQIVDFITNMIPTLIPTLFDTSVSLISGFINGLIAIIVSVYMLTDKHQLINNGKRLVYALLGEQKGDDFLKTGTECNRIFSNFIIGKLIDSLIIGILCFIGMTIIKLPYALMISVFVGITNMIPYFGPFIGAVPGIVLLLFVDWSYALIFGIWILILQQFDGLYLGPRILGQSTGLRPIWIIFAITVGGYVGGVLGMFLGVPVTAVIAFLLERAITKQLGNKKIFFYTDPDTGILNRQLKSLPAEIVPVKETDAEEKATPDND